METSETMANMRKNKVFVTNLGYHDYTLAKRFGELVFLTEGRLNYVNSERIEGMTHKKLQDAQEGDFLLLSGSAFICVVATAFMIRKFGCVKLLIWDQMLRDYILREITGDDREELRNSFKDGAI